MDFAVGEGEAEGEDRPGRHLGEDDKNGEITAKIGRGITAKNGDKKATGIHDFWGR